MENWRRASAAVAAIIIYLRVLFTQRIGFKLILLAFAKRSSSAFSATLCSDHLESAAYAEIPDFISHDRGSGFRDTRRETNASGASEVVVLKRLDRPVSEDR